MQIENSESNSDLICNAKISLNNNEITPSRKWVVFIRILPTMSCSAVQKITMIMEGYIDFVDRCRSTDVGDRF